jgi:hypothetical protein
MPWKPEKRWTIDWKYRTIPFPIIPLLPPIKYKKPSYLITYTLSKKDVPSEMPLPDPETPDAVSES